MAVVVSRQQTALTRIQIAHEERAEQIQRTANWNEMRNIMWELMDSHRPKSPAGLTMSRQEWQEWFVKVRRMLDSQHGNPVLISDRESLGYWRNAISSAKHGEDAARSRSEQEYNEAANRTANGILKDVSTVWQRLVLDSVEVSATGGRPNQTTSQGKEAR
jgi:hypothetical protein